MNLTAKRPWPILALFILLSACESEKITEYLRLTGEAQGTTYAITYLDSQNRNFQPAVDSLLDELNLEISTYLNQSTISRFNRASDTIHIGFDPSLTSSGPLPFNYHFVRNLRLSLEMHQLTREYFDPTVMPLVRYYGFGKGGPNPESIDPVAVDSLRQLVGLEKVRLEGSILFKDNPGVQLDFNAIGQGYGVDLVGQYLEKQGVTDYMVEIGGEVRARGQNPNGKAWTIGINTPKEGAAVTDFVATAELLNTSLATSGNYRKYVDIQGKKYAHIINPETGYPEESNLLSVSVFAANCAKADALATGFLAMGLDKAYELALQLDGVEAYFIYALPDGALDVKQTEGLAGIIKPVSQ